MSDLFTHCLQCVFGGEKLIDPLWICLSGAFAVGGLQFAGGGKRRPKAHGSKLIKNTGVAEKLALYLSSPTVRATMRAILFSQSREDVWQWLVATPPGSSLEKVLAEFRQRTSVSLELIFMEWISLLAQFMAEKGARVRCGNQMIRLDLYTVVLAESGALKSWGLNRMLAAIRSEWVPNTILDPGSTSGLLKQLKKNDGKACMWRIEEFGAFWCELSKEHHAGTKRLLLMNYDGEPCGKGLKDEEVIVQNPYLSFLGTTVAANLSRQMLAEDWKSGMCQRIGFVLAAADPDPKRDWGLEKYAMLKVDEPKIAREFEKMMRVPVHQEYEFSAEAIRQIGKSWTMLATQGDHEFVRRVEFRGFKYAAIFHWMMGKRSKWLDAEDVTWAMRLAMLHLADLRGILDSTEFADFESLISRGEKLRQKCLRAGEPFRPRDLQMRFSRQLRSIEEAKSLFLLVCERAARAGLPGVPSDDEIFAMTGVAPGPGGPVTRVPAVIAEETSKKKKYEK